MAQDFKRGDGFPTAHEDARSAETVRSTPQTRSPSFRLAYADTDFMLRDELRPVRLQLELLKPELLLQEARVDTTVVVFGSARVPDPAMHNSTGEQDRDSNYYEQAREFARIVSKACQTDGIREFVVITGGGGGIMEAANRGAHDAGAVSVGLNIVLPKEQCPNPYITPELSFQFHYFGLRKMHFLMRARALAFFPGGFGTMDELFDALTLLQTRKIKPMPVLLFGEAYWRRVLNFEAMAEEGMIAPEDIDLIQYVEEPEDAWNRIRAFYGRGRGA
jgi:uncharacterized protein (TIGR00730 family)